MILKDLSRIYRLYARLNDSFEQITTTFRDFVYQKGNEVISEKKNQMEASTDKKESTNVRYFILVEFNFL